MSEADELEKLHQLLAKGALTAAQYEQAKARLLASAPSGELDLAHALRAGLVFGGLT